MAALLREVPQCWLSVSATTRAPREGEREGVEYFFVSDEDFDRLVSEDALLEWAFVHGQRYGTLQSIVEEHIAAGEQVILEIDCQGGFQVKEKIPSTHLVFIEPPSLEVLEDRLRKRGTEGEEKITERMRTAKLELLRKKEYDVSLINDDLEKAVSELVAYVKGQTETE